MEQNDQNSSVLNDSNEVLKNLYLAQKELIEATKLEASKHERTIIECQRKAEEYQKLRIAEEETAKQIEINNRILERRLEISEEILEILKINIEEKPIEKSIQNLTEILNGVRVIAELTAKELIQRIYKEITSEKERNELMKALVDIGKSRHTIESNINLTSEKDIHTRDIIGTKND